MRAGCADFETELVESVSASRLRLEFPAHIRKYPWGEHFWSPSYFASSCAGAPLRILKEYIENQKRPD
ncbi:transposase [Kitasatospora sp. NPDC093558]|uniref:transposase n=1 Tax=Kitasatospora sp. NPDC093558 TaxID=3155201 RepID=UPI00341754CD